MRLIDADSLKERLLSDIPEEHNNGIRLMLRLLCLAIDEEPTVDAVANAVQVVRCGDCIFYHKYTDGYGACLCTRNLLPISLERPKVFVNQYCSNGEREKMSHSLCNRCDHYSVCGLNFDGKPCHKMRTVEPTNYDRIMEMDAEQLAVFQASHVCPPGSTAGTQNCITKSYAERKCTSCWLEYLNTETKEDLV